MSVIPVTIFFSLLLAGLFVALFAREQRRRRFASAERESLLPLADETPRPAARPPSR
jgi:cbb3-type cytochrome oxidase subunit 3